MNWNIHRLFNKCNVFTALIDKLNCEVISLCETWLNKCISNRWLSLANYDLYRLDRSTRRKGGGLCVYNKSKNSCNSTKYKHLNTSLNEIELMVLDICLPSTTPIVLLSCYRPPSENVETATERFRCVINEIPTNCEIYVMGDFNLDYLCKGSPSFKKLSLFERTFQLKPIITIRPECQRNLPALLIIYIPTLT